MSISLKIGATIIDYFDDFPSIIISEMNQEGRMAS